MINSFESISIIKAGILTDFYLFNKFGIDLISQILTVMLSKCIIHPGYFTCLLHDLLFFNIKTSN